MLTLVLSALLSAPAGLQLEVVGEVDGCPLWRHLPGSLSRLLETVRIGGVPTDGDVTVTLEPLPRAVRLRLTDWGGGTLLVREVPLEAGLCAPVADVIALIIERYLRDIGWSPSADGLPRAPPREDEEVASVARAALDVGLRADLAGEGGSGWRPGGSLWLRTSLGRWEAGFGTTTWQQSSRAVLANGEQRGELELRSFDGLLFAGGCDGLGAHRGCVDLLGGVELVSASARGDTLFQLRSESSWDPELGLETRYEYSLPGVPVSLLAGASITVRPWRSGFIVRGADSEERAAAFTCQLAVGAWWQVLGSR